MARPTITLYRPVGPAELALIEQASFGGFPPRFPEQPIFYPVCNQQYAEMITRKWNIPDHGVGYVTRFDVDAEFLSSYERHLVGGRECEEYWIPADELAAFNAAIVGKIEVISEFRDSD